MSSVKTITPGMALKKLGQRCCAKCEWWTQDRHSGWGRCASFDGERCWCNSPVCTEYEEKPNPQEYCECRADEL